MNPVTVSQLHLHNLGHQTKWFRVIDICNIQHTKSSYFLQIIWLTVNGAQKLYQLPAFTWVSKSTSSSPKPRFCRALSHPHRCWKQVSPASPFHPAASITRHLPSRDMPTARHFCSRQCWQRLRLVRSIRQFF